MITHTCPVLLYGRSEDECQEVVINYELEPVHDPKLMWSKFEEREYDVVFCEIQTPLSITPFDAETCVEETLRLVHSARVNVRCRIEEAVSKDMMFI